MKADLFLDCIFLLINNNSTRYQKLVLELIQDYEAEAKVKEGSDAELIRFYIAICQELIRGQVDRDDPDALTAILIKFKTNKALSKFHDVIDALKESFSSRKVTDEAGVAAVERKITGIVERVKAEVIRKRVDKSNRKIFARMQSSSGVEAKYQIQDLIEIKNELARMADEIDVDDATEVYTGVQPVGMVAFHDRETVQKALAKRRARECKGVIKSGLQGLNRALGEAEGLIPGESICHAALSHHGKSLMIGKWALWGVEYNPAVEDENGVPMILLISNENEEYRNMMDIFKTKYMQVENKPPRGMSDEDIENWIIDYFAKFNTKFVIERYTDDFGFREFKQRLTYWRSNGYRLVMVCLDYLSNMKLFSDDKNASRGSRESGLREISNQLVNDARIGGYAFVTGHQLNRKAEEIAESNTVPVKKFNLNCLQDSSSIFREFDIMHFQYNEVVESSGIKYFEGFIGKHRHVVTPESHKFYAYPYLEGYGIKDDLGGAPGFVSDPYAADFASPDTFDGPSGSAGVSVESADAF